MEHELLLARVEDVDADDVARHQVGRALDTLEAAAEAARERFRDQRLAEARRALQQDVAARDAGREQPVDHAVRAVDDAADLAVEVEFEVLTAVCSCELFPDVLQTIVQVDQVDALAFLDARVQRLDAVEVIARYTSR